MRKEQFQEIPEGNLWLLMLYASDLYDYVTKFQNKKSVSIEDSPNDIPTLVAKLLCHFLENRFRNRNLSYDYQTHNAYLTRVRGRIDHSTTARYSLRRRALIACQFDEMSLDTPRNCYALAALEAISKKCDKKLLQRCCSVANRMRRMGVTDKNPYPEDPSINHFTIHEKEDRLMINISHLAFNLTLPKEELGSRYLPQLDREELNSWNLFEKGIAGFYSNNFREDDGWEVDTTKKIYWKLNDLNLESVVYQREMEPDLVLENKRLGRCVIIDAKSGMNNRSSVQNNGEKQESIFYPMDDIYQINGYLTFIGNENTNLSKNMMGILLYASFESMIEFCGELPRTQQKIKIATVNLKASADEIRSQLLKIIKLNS